VVLDRSTATECPKRRRKCRESESDTMNESSFPIKKVVFLAIGLYLIYVAFNVGGGVLSFVQHLAEAITTPKSAVQAPSLTILNPSEVYESVLEVSKLVTIEHRYGIAFQHRDVTTILGGLVPIGATDLSYRAGFVIQSGVSLEGIRVSVDGTQIKVVMNPAQVFAIYKESGGFTNIDQKLFADVKAETVNKVEEEAKNMVLTSACENGILQQASQKAAEQVGSLLQKTYSGANIVIEQTQSYTCP
jgi:hypothetical protein